MLPLLLSLACCQDPALPERAVLVGRAVLPARTFAEGPPSGARIDPERANGEPVPFPSQPVQGFSGIVVNGDGSFDVLADNGYGAIENSADFRLRTYTIRPDFKTRDGGSGTIAVEGFVELQSGWLSSFPRAYSPGFRPAGSSWATRAATGSDLDVESITRVGDELWIGDEFGPFLLCYAADGRLKEAPHALPHPESQGVLRAPWNPVYAESRLLRTANHYSRVSEGGPALVVSPWHRLLEDGDESTPADEEVISVDTLHAAGHRVVVWTVNEPERMRALLALGVDGIISDRPDLLLEELRAFDADGDGVPGDLLDEQGRVRPERFDVQGHRGARHLRPENTLPAMEVALDLGVSTLELDCVPTLDSVPVLSHDPLVDPEKWRRVGELDRAWPGPVHISGLRLDELQRAFVADGLPGTQGEGQYAATRELALSPVSAAFAEWVALPHAYTPPSLAQVLDFVGFYELYYSSGPGRAHPHAAARARSARRARFNVETKCGPFRNPHTRPPSVHGELVRDVVVGLGRGARVDLQSFDHTVLLSWPDALGRCLLFGEAPDGPTRSAEPPLVRTSAGLEGLARKPDGTLLYPMLEAPLVGASERHLRILEFEVGPRRFTGREHRYPLEPRGEAIGDFVLHSDTHGLVLERDWSEGDLEGFKRLYEIRLDPQGGLVSKALVADLLNIADPHGISLPAAEGDVGLGERFAFPFVTIENIVVLGPRRVGILNDNNYPFSVGRHVGSGRPDDTEFIVLELPRPLGSYAR